MPKWTEEQKKRNLQKMIERYGSYENYCKHLREIARAKPSKESILKQLETKRKRYPATFWVETGGRRNV